MAAPTTPGELWKTEEEMEAATRVRGGRKEKEAMTGGGLPLCTHHLSLTEGMPGELGDTEEGIEGLGHDV